MPEAAEPQGYASELFFSFTEETISDFFHDFRTS